MFDIVINDSYQTNIEKYKRMVKNKKRPYVFGYARLSRDDDKEQNSLKNQKGIIQEYAKQQGYDIINIIEDDNISGMTFDRDGLSILKDLIDAELVDIILVKDLSRLGRHKAYSALFINYLNQKGIKAISVTENIDTSNENDDILIGFKQIINEQYSKDLSRKIRAGMKQKQKKEGLVIIPPFGYYKNKNTGEIEIVEECADIVRLIFKLYTEKGMGAKKIANYLTEHGYKTPAQYQKELLNKSVPHNKTIYAGIAWNDRTITRLLKTDAYIGVLRCNTSYKNNIYDMQKRLPPEEHIVHENYYPPILDRETWDMAQIIRENRSKNKVRASTNSKIHRYAGLIKCGDCNSTFTAKRRYYRGNEYIEYVCNTYHRHGVNFCSSHRVKEVELDSFIYKYLDRLKTLAEENLLHVDDFIKEWNNKKRDYDKEIRKIKLEIIQLKEDIKQYAKQLARGLIDDELFNELTQDTKQKIDYLEKQIETLNEMIEINKNAKQGIQKSVDMLTNIVRNKELSDAHLQMIINKIIVYENEDKELNLEIVLNAPFKYHASLANFFTDNTSSCASHYLVIELLNMLNQMAECAGVVE